MGYRKDIGEASFNNLYHNYKNNAKNRGLIFDINKEELKKLTKQRCHYCNAEPSNICKERNGGGNYIYNGIDRVDNTIGYLISNCVSCCAICNIMKRHHTVEEFKEQILRIYINLFEQ